MKVTGLFVGITTMDIQYLVDQVPAPNLKSKALGFNLATGGPATNAAVTFAHLGGHSCLCSEIGDHPFTPFIRQELEGLGVELKDLTPASPALPPFSSIMTTHHNGDRTVLVHIGDPKVGTEIEAPPINVQNFDILLVDGYQMKISTLLAAQARKKGVLVVLDGGSWKEGMHELLPHVDIAICSADFRPPGSSKQTESKSVLDFLSKEGVTYSAITQGGKPVLFYDGQRYGQIEVEAVEVVDTLGAGDIFHGAFCCFFAQTKDFEQALREAAIVASRSCETFGTREWLKGTEENDCQITPIEEER